MQNKLQELTDKLYNEGLSKGKSEGEAILANAKAQSEEIIAQAKKEAQAIMAGAQKEAQDLKTRTAGEIALASRQSISQTRQAIEGLVIAEAVQKNVKAALSDEDFVKGLITEAVKAFAGGKDCDLEICLPQTLKGQLESFIRKEVSKSLGKEVEVKYSKTGAGFTIGPKNGGYFISFTDEAFSEIIGNYLRPATKKILFG
ncbi:MAG: hypothetical protein ACI39U_03310 [Candidatus Cryptobacteroides sp.]